MLLIIIKMLKKTLSVPLDTYQKWGWDKDAYVRGAQDDGDEGQAHQARVQEATAIASMVDDAVTDVLWWAWVMMMDKLCLLLREAARWAGRCSCHEKYIKQHVLEVFPKVLKVIAQCPLRGRRAPELSKGAFFHMLQDVADTTAADLVAQLPAGIPAQSRVDLLQEFDLGRAHIDFYFAVKLSYLSEEPWCIVQLADSDLATQSNMIRQVLASQCQHPLWRLP